MSINMKSKQRDAGYLEKCPNEDPESHICLYENFKKEVSNISTAFDVSGSQNCPGGKDLLEFMKHCNGKDIKSSFYPFGNDGNDGIMESFPDFERFNRKYNIRSKFITATYTHSLNDFLSRTKERGINQIVIVGDGDFSMEYDGSIMCSGTTKFLDHLKTVNLSHIQSIRLVFSPHTKSSIIESLKKSLFSILGTSDNALDVDCIKLEFIEKNGKLKQMYDLYKDLRTSICVPKNHVLVGKLFSFDKRMTDRNLAKVILDKHTHIIGELEDYIKYIIQNKPHLLIQEDTIYSRLHNVLKIILKDSYINWISLEKSRAPEGEKLQALTELLNNSYNKDAEVDELCKKIEPYVIGYGIFPDALVTKKQILDMLKDGSCVMIKNFITNILKSDRFIYEPRKSKSIVRKGMLIVRPRKKNDGPEYTEILRLGLKTLMFQFGNYLLEGNRTYISGLSFLVNEENLNGGKKIPPIIKRSIKDAIFGDKEYTFRMLGFDSKAETLELADNLCSPPIMKLVGMCVINFPKEMFISVGKQERELRYIMSKFIRLQNILKTYKVLDFNLKRLIKIKITEISVGDIVYVGHYVGEPQVNLPAVAVIRTIRKSKKKKKRVADIEYLDRCMNDVKKDIRFGAELSKLKVICSLANSELILNLNTHLMKQQVEGYNGLYNGEKNEFGEKMKMDAEYDESFREMNDKLVIEIIDKYNKKSGRTNDIEYKMEDIEVPIPEEHILEILKYCFKLNDKLITLLKSGARLNKKDILECTEIMYQTQECDMVLNQIVYRDHDFVIGEGDIARIKDSFRKGLEQNKITLSSISKSKYCPICLEEKSIDEFTSFIGCNHPICLECKDMYDEQTKYEPGSIVKIRFHQCCECSHLIRASVPDEILQVYDRHEGSIPGNMRLRYCNECNELFEETLDCGTDEESMPNLCLACRPVIDDADAMKICPKCEEGILKNQGCDHMTCLWCKAEWCWGCRRQFSNEIKPLLGGINWVCDGPCSDVSESKYLDNPDDFMGY